jgi:hypothetical protein
MNYLSYENVWRKNGGREEGVDTTPTLMELEAKARESLDVWSGNFLICRGYETIAEGLSWRLGS